MEPQLPARNRALKLLRERRGWTQQELADAVGRKPGTISNYERGVEVLSERKLLEFAAAMGQTAEMVRDVLFLVEAPAEPRARWVGPVYFTADEERETWELGAEEGRQKALFYRQCLVRTRVAQKVAADRAEAQELMVNLRREPHLCDFIRERREYQTWAVSEALCEASIATAPSNPQRTLEYSEAAVVAAELATGDEKWRLLVQGLAHAHVGNAFKVLNRFKTAEKAFKRCDACRKAGSGGDPNRVLNEGRVFGLKAALLTVRQHLPEALEVLQEGISVSNQDEMPYLLLSKAKALEEHEDYEGAIQALSDAAPLIRERDSRLLLTLRFDLLVNLCNLKRFPEVEALLGEVRGLAVLVGNHLDLLRLRWLEGLQSAGVGRLQQAVETLSVVRNDFMALNLGYDAALVTLDVAEVLLELQQPSRVKELARQMAPLFSGHGVHANARKALSLFRSAALIEAVTREFVKDIAKYLRLARSKPDLEFLRK